MENIDYKKRIEQLQNLIEAELKILKQIIESSEYKKLDVKYQTLKESTKYSQEEKCAKYFNLRGEIKELTPFTCPDSEVFREITEPKTYLVLRTPFRVLLSEYESRLQEYTNKYLKSDAIKIKVRNEREQLQNLNHLVKKRREFVICFLDGINALKIKLPETLQDEIQQLRNKVVEIDKCKDKFNEFVDNYQKQDKKERISSEHNIMLNYPEIFKNFLEETLTSLKEIIGYYDKEKPGLKLSEKFLATHIISKKHAFHSRDKLKEIFEQAIPGLVINLEKKVSKEEKREKTLQLPSKDGVESTPTLRKWAINYRKALAEENPIIQDQDKEVDPDIAHEQTGKFGGP